MGFDPLNSLINVKLIIPIIANKIQDEIKAKITEMYKAKILSNELLNIAKRGVELVIEKDEKKAQEWVNLELNKQNRFQKK